MKEGRQRKGGREGGEGESKMGEKGRQKERERIKETDIIETKTKAK